MILQRVTPVTHSVGNCLKRVIVIVASVIVFQNPMSKQNMIGKFARPLPCPCSAMLRLPKGLLHVSAFGQTLIYCVIASMLV